MILGNMNEEHPSGLCPSSINGVWNEALSEAYTKSNSPMIVTDIPTAGPLTAAIRGLGKSIKCATNFLSKKKEQMRVEFTTFQYLFIINNGLIMIFVKVKKKNGKC